MTKVDLCVNITKVCCLYGDRINVVENLLRNPLNFQLYFTSRINDEHYL